MLHTCTHACRGHADLLCVVPALTDDPGMESAVYAVYAGQLYVKCESKLNINKIGNLCLCE